MPTFEIRYKTQNGRYSALILAADKDEAKDKYYKNVSGAKTSASISIEMIEKKAFNVTRSTYKTKI